MSIVRYVNKKTGTVAVYESTSHYDPKTKQSRPIRKYLGTEDPETKELIPSSGRRGRKKSGAAPEREGRANEGPDYMLIAENLKKECAEKDARIRKLEMRNKALLSAICRIREIACRMPEPEDQSAENG